MTVGTGTGRKFRANALMNAPVDGREFTDEEHAALLAGGSGGGVIAGPVFASLPLGVDLSVQTRLAVPQHAKTRLSIEVFGVDRTPVDVTNFPMRFVVFDDNGTVTAQVDAGRITKDLELGNRCYVNLLPSDVPDDGQFRWALWDRSVPDEPERLGKGAFIVELAAIGSA